jgi:hypothetical protein
VGNVDGKLTEKVKFEDDACKMAPSNGFGASQMSAWILGNEDRYVHKGRECDGETGTRARRVGTRG